MAGKEELDLESVLKALEIFGEGARKKRGQVLWMRSSDGSRATGRSRRKQILQALNDNGPLSVENIGECAEAADVLAESFRRLQSASGTRGSSFHTSSLCSNNGAHFYRIPHDPKVRARVARWLGIPAEQLRQPKFFSKELQHTTQAALWAARMKEMFPEGKVVRDLQIHEAMATEK